MGVCGRGRVLDQYCVKGRQPGQESKGVAGCRSGTHYVSATRLDGGKVEGGVEEGKMVPNIETIVGGEVWNPETIQLVQLVSAVCSGHC
jgi:hypothetical protein